MAFQGSLKDFSITDVLQMVGNQNKSGCLVLENGSQRAVVYVVDGRLVSTRTPGMAGDDPLLRFLLETHRLSDEQHRGILTIQRESGRDLEDLLLNGRYMDADDLGRFIERQILHELTTLVGWSSGNYRFDANQRWPYPPLARIPTEAAILEVVRRLDEQKRHAILSDDPHQVLALRDLPDPDTLLSEEECEVFGIVDGHRTIAEIIAAAPLSRYEGYETLFNMLENGWIEVSGRREQSGANASPLPAAHARADASARGTQKGSLAREVGVALVVLVAIAVLRLATIPLQPARSTIEPDVFAASRAREVETALDLYARENGHYPDDLEKLSEDRWMDSARLHARDVRITYRALDGQSRYELDVVAAR